MSHTLGPRTKAIIWKEHGSDPLANLGEPPREAGGNWGHTHLWQMFQEFVPSQGHWCWQVSFWNLSFNLLAKGPGSCPPVYGHQYWDTSGQVKQLAQLGHSPTHQQASCLKTSCALSLATTCLRPPEGLGPRPTHQYTSTSPGIPSSGSTGTWLHPPVGWH